MAKSSKPSTPLQLLEQLSGDLLAHFEKACRRSRKEAERLSSKLEKERVRVQGKLHKAQEKRNAAIEAGKAKAQARAESKLEELETLMTLIEARQQNLRAYLDGLRQDIERSLQLAEGIRAVQQAAAEAQQGGEATAVSAIAEAPAAPSIAGQASRPRAGRNNGAVRKASSNAAVLLPGKDSGPSQSS